MSSTIRRVLAVLGALAVAAASTAAPVSAGPGDEITLTLIRHAESAGNTSGFVDTSTPGPGLTDLGWAQAHRVADDYAHADFDGVFASSMVRTQQTAEFLAAELDEPVDVLPGLREIEAGTYEGRPEAGAAEFYGVLRQWADGDRGARIPGSIDGNEFDARFDEAVRTIACSGDRHPVAFSHGGAIALWTLMNAENADPALLATQPLPNTGYVVLRGDPVDGWKLLDWNGTRID